MTNNLTPYIISKSVRLRIFSLPSKYVKNDATHNKIPTQYTCWVKIYAQIFVRIHDEINMLYVLAHFLRDKMPWAWNLVDQLNSVLFSLRYGHKLKKFRFKTPHKNYQIIPICNIPTDALVKFFAHQPNEAYKFFRPHGFDPKSLLVFVYF